MSNPKQIKLSSWVIKTPVANNVTVATTQPQHLSVQSSICDSSVLRKHPDLSSATPLKKPEVHVEQEASKRAISLTPPPKKTGKRVYNFQPYWLEKYKWLELSLDGRAFCKVCKEAKHKNLMLDSVPLRENFISQGFVNWKDGNEKFALHEKSKQHFLALAKVSAIKATPINIIQSTNLLKSQAMARIALRAMFTSVLYLAKQGMPLFGDSFEKGNYIQLLRLRSSDIPELSKWLEGSKPLTCTDIQNEMLKTIALAMSRRIQAKIITNGEFSIIVDETTDISVKEQVSICVRTVTSELEVQEDFLGFYETGSTKSDNLVSIIKDALARFGLNIKNLRGQCFDGAANMSGIKNGVSAQILEIEPRAVYVHCYAHCLNLAIQDSIRSVPLLRDCLSYVHEVGVILKGSAKRLSLYQAIQNDFEAENDADNAGTKIKPQPLCETRWTVRGKNVTAVINNYRTVMKFLLELAKGTDKVATKANGLYHQLSKATTYFGLLVLQLALLPTENLSRNIQSEKSTVGRMVLAAEETKELFTSYKSRNNFTEIWGKVAKASKEFDLEPASLGRVKKAPRRFGGQASCVFESVEEMHEALLRKSMEIVVAEMSSRFSQDGVKKLQNLEEILLTWDTMTHDRRTKNLEMLSKDYGIDSLSFDFQMRIVCANKKVDRCNLSSIFTSFKALPSDLRELVPEVQKLMKILLVVPISSCTAERSFSVLRRIKEYLRSTMTQSRLNHCCIINAYQQIASDLDVEELMRDFVNNNNRNRVFGTW